MGQRSVDRAYRSGHPGARVACLWDCGIELGPQGIDEFVNKKLSYDPQG